MPRPSEGVLGRLQGALTRYPVYKKEKARSLQKRKSDEELIPVGTFFMKFSLNGTRITWIVMGEQVLPGRADRKC